MQQENPTMKETRIDDFATADGWQAFASGEAEMKITAEAGALRLDFDFHGGGGFVVARKEFQRTIPADYAFAFRVRGKVIAGVAAWKNHLSYYPFSGSLLSHFKEDLKDFKGTKSAVHFTPEKMIPAVLVRKMVRMRLGR